MIVRAVLDPGVLVAALLSKDGTPAQLLTRWLAGEFEIVASPKLLGELARVLARPKFKAYVSEVEVRAYLQALARGTITLDDPDEHGFVEADPGGDYLVALARSARVDALISGDDHLLGLTAANPPVLTPREFLKRLRGA